MIIQEEKVEIVDVEEEKKQQETNTTEGEKEKTSIKHIFMYITVFAIVLAIILLIIFLIFTIYNIKNENIISQGIYIYGIDVSNLTKTEAKEKVTQAFSEIETQNIELIATGVTDTDATYYTTYIDPTEIDLKYDITSAINYAYKIGKNGNIFTDNYDIFSAMTKGINITPTCSYDTEKLQTLLSEISKDLPDAVIEGSYYIEDNKLILTKGQSGYAVDVSSTLENIEKSIANFSYLTESINLVLVGQDPEELDLDEIYNEVHKEAQDAYYTTDPFTVHPSSTGIDFNISLDEAKKLLAESETECEIELKTLYPEVTTNMIGSEAFPDLLATYSTKYATSNTNRVTNLKLAANKINGTVLLPGETFSYNQVVGERTIAAGYKEAGIYLNGEETTGLGGGICQISTTLFNAALYANLEMVEVHNHQFVPQYSSTGRDATVVYGTKDFQFKNSRNYAIKIECSVSGGIAKFSIYGVKEETEYDVSIYAKVISQTSSYIKSQTYRILKLRRLNNIHRKNL